MKTMPFLFSLLLVNVGCGLSSKKQAVDIWSSLGGESVLSDACLDLHANQGEDQGEDMAYLILDVPTTNALSQLHPQIVKRYVVDSAYMFYIQTKGGFQHSGFIYAPAFQQQRVESEFGHFSISPITNGWYYFEE